MGRDAAAWAAAQAALLPAVPTSLAFIHIPLPQFMAAWSAGPTNGSMGEEVACPLVDTGVFHTLRCEGSRTGRTLGRYQLGGVVMGGGWRDAGWRLCLAGQGAWGPPCHTCLLLCIA